MLVDYRDKAVLITGGTRGIGLASALAFARRGASVTVTHKWGSVDEDAVSTALRSAGAENVDIVQADTSNADDIRTVLTRIQERHGAPTAVVCNVAVAPPVRDVSEMVQRNLHRAIDYSAWPLVSHVQLTHEICGRYPRYVIGVSSAGAEAMHVNYDFAAAAKAVLETLIRYLSHRLAPSDVRVNGVRTRFVKSESLRSIFGDAFEPFVDKYAADLFTPAEQVGDAIYGLCSGLMDGMTGQILDVDGGAGFADGFSRFYRDFHRGNWPTSTTEKKT